MRLLLEDHNLVGVDEVEEILKEHDTAGGLLIVSYGSVCCHDMAYG